MERQRFLYPVLLLVWGVVLLHPVSTYANNPLLYAPLARYLPETAAGCLFLAIGAAGLLALWPGISTRFQRFCAWLQFFCLAFMGAMFLQGAFAALATWTAVVLTPFAFARAWEMTIEAGRRHEARQRAKAGANESSGD